MRFANPSRIRSGVAQSPPVSPPAVARAEAQNRIPWWRLWPVIVAGVVAVLLVAVVWPRPVEQKTDKAAFEKAVEDYLRRRPPTPTPANIAFAVIQPSLIVVQGRSEADQEGDPSSLGTGVVVDENGTILTCLHVVAGSDKIFVTFADGFETEAQLVSAHADNDLAVLMPDVVPENLVAAILAGSGGLRIGDPVVAVGNPFGLVGSVSQGVVSGLNRTTGGDGFELKGLIQFDAAVNPGNSGGPLLNQQGEVVGLVTALINPTKQNFFVGIGYAITMETAGRAFDIPPW